MNWDSISFGVGDEPIKRILMAEPLKGTKAHVADLLDSSTDCRRPGQEPPGLSPDVERSPPMRISTHIRSHSSGSHREPLPIYATAEGGQKQAPRKGGDDSDGEDGAKGPQKLAKKGEELKEEMDALVDEIDEVLEENAEEFVKNYVQRGGE